MLIQPAQLEDLERLSSSIESHRPTVYLITFVICAVFSYAMLTSYRSAKSEKWIKYIGVASAILAAQYLVRVVCWYLGEQGTPDPVRYDSSPVVQSILQILSAAGSVWFLATARELKNRKPAFPKWAWALFAGAILVTAAGDFLMMPDHWLSIFLARSIERVFSALCLVLLGHAIYSNISFRVSRWSASVAMFSVFLYALVNILSWFSPMLAHFLSTPGVLEERMIRQLLDSSLMAISLPLKLSIFLPAYGLLLRFVETLNDLAKLQDKVIDARQDYLSSDGVVQLISEKLRGEVDLIILLPGERNRRLASIPWPNKDPEKRAQVLDWTVCDLLIHESLLGSKELAQSRSDRGPFVVIEPIEAHGTAIGCLKISRNDYPFSQMAVRQIKAIANLVSPAVQSYRELAALDLLSVRFAERHSEETTYPPKEAARIIAEILHDVFSPFVTRLHFDFGFQSVEPLYPGDDSATQSMKEKINWAEWNQLTLDFSHQDTIGLKLFKKRLTARSEYIAKNALRLDRNIAVIGNLVFAALRARDEHGHPTLGASYLHRKAAATLASDAYLDFARDYFSSIVKKFGVRLSRRTMSVEEWFEPVRELAEKAGFSWVMASGEGANPLGGSDYVTLEQFQRELTEQRTTSVVYEEYGVRVKFYSLSTPLANAQHVIELALPGSEKAIWLGVERPGFGAELSFSSPWKHFLLDFAKVADAALTRLTYSLELQRTQIEAAHYQGLASAAVTTGTIIHQLSNLAHGQSASTSALLDALATGKLTASEEIQDLMYSMKRSSERMRTFLSAITNVTKTDDRRPSLLLEAAQQAGVLFEASLLQRKIELHIAADRDLLLDVPFSIATLAIANLISNAKDAMPGGGVIRIEAETNGDMVLCRVIDQGRGIPKEILDRIFDIGFTTKHGAGTGWGLYLTKRSLQENRSKIELTETGDKGSTFTIYFPGTKQEGL